MSTFDVKNCPYITGRPAERSVTARMPKQGSAWASVRGPAIVDRTPCAGECERGKIIKLPVQRKLE